MADATEVQLKRGVLELCVLAYLAAEDNYAYEIATFLAREIGMGEGTIYPLVRRMQTDGLLDDYSETAVDYMVDYLARRNPSELRRLQKALTARVAA